MGILAGRLVCLGQYPAEFESFRGERVMANEKPQKNKMGDLQRADGERTRLKARPKVIQRASIRYVAAEAVACHVRRDCRRTAPVRSC